MTSKKVQDVSMSDEDNLVMKMIQNVLMKGLSGQSGVENCSKCLHERLKWTKWF